MLVRQVYVGTPAYVENQSLIDLRRSVREVVVFDAVRSFDVL